MLRNFSKYKEVLGLVVAIFTSVTFVYNQLSNGVNYVNFPVIIDLVNVAVLLVAFVTIKIVVWELDNSEMEVIQSLLKIDAETAAGIRDRLNILVKQLVTAIRWFILILGIFYLLQSLIDISPISYKEIKEVLRTNHNVMEVLSRSDQNNISAAKYVAIEVLTNASNLFSAAFLFVAFQVLFSKTVEEDNATWNIRYWGPFSIAILLTMANIHLVIAGFNEASLDIISHMIRLLGGIYNGVAMCLLFARFISMEYFFQYATTWHRQFYLYGTIIILPLYAVVQPLYGLFNAVEIGNDPILFKSFVFLICFWGKLAFLLFIYTTLAKKWLHCYLFMVLSNNDTLSHLSKKIAEIDDFRPSSDPIIVQSDLQQN